MDAVAAALATRSTVIFQVLRAAYSGLIRQSRPTPGLHHWIRYQSAVGRLTHDPGRVLVWSESGTTLSLEASCCRSGVASSSPFDRDLSGSEWCFSCRGCCCFCGGYSVHRNEEVNAIRYGRRINGRHRLGHCLPDVSESRANSCDSRHGPLGTREIHQQETRWVCSNLQWNCHDAVRIRLIDTEP